MKVSPCLAALEDLKSQKEQLERERGNQFTENDILEFVADLLQGDPADKDYQKKLIDNLVVKVFVSDGYMTAHIKLGNATEVADIRLEEVKKALEHLFTSVQTLSPLGFVDKNATLQTKQKGCINRAPENRKTQSEIFGKEEPQA